jgi:hypothetical protein
MVKLHTHWANRNGQRYHAYTRDRSGKVLKNEIGFQKSNDQLVFLKRDWTYFRSIDIDIANKNSRNYEIYETVFRTGVCVATIDKYPYKIFVFEAKFDQADAKIYSIDEDLSSFHRFFGDLKLSAKGDTVGYDEIEFKGVYSDKYYFQLQDYGVNLDQIDKTNFSIVFSDRSLDSNEYYRRYLQRTLREDMPKILSQKYGVDLTELKVDNLIRVASMKVRRSDSQDLEIESANKTNPDGQVLDAHRTPTTKAEASSNEAQPPQQPLLVYDDVRAQLLAIGTLAPHPRGYAFEKFLFDLFRAQGADPRASFRNRGEQIDGSFSLAGHHYLMEAKWEAQPCEARPLHAFESQLREKAIWTRGLFISYAGFSSDGLVAFGRAKHALLMDSQDLLEMLSRKLTLQEVLERKARRASETGLPFVNVKDLF